MGDLPYALYRAEQVRALDRAAIEDFSIPGYELMCRAGQASLDLMRRQWSQARRLLIYCGTGNNGGDGYVIGRLARATGLDVVLCQIGDSERISGDADTARQAYLQNGGIEVPFEELNARDFDVIVDAMLGTGLEREIEGRYQAAIASLDGLRQRTLAIDIPSGLHSDRGVVMGAAVAAAHTISFIGLKQGMFTGDAADFVGRVHFSGLGVPPKVYARQILSAQRLEWSKFSEYLGSRPKVCHKGDFGHVLLIGGESGYTGAILMAGKAALRAGAGLVSIATRAEHAPLLNVAHPELMSQPAETPCDLKPLVAKADIVAIGPGLGRGRWGREMIRTVRRLNKPLIMDADALNLLSTHPGQRPDWILTPHPGEAARLLECTIEDIQADRFAAVQALRQRYGGVVVLKGAGSLVAHDQRTVGVCDAGNPGMAVAGMGDVLTGVIAALRAQGLGPKEAAQMGACLHATAGDCAAEAEGERGLLPTDLIPWIRALINGLA